MTSKIQITLKPKPIATKILCQYPVRPSLMELRKKVAEILLSKQKKRTCDPVIPILKLKPMSNHYVPIDKSTLKDTGCILYINKLCNDIACQSCYNKSFASHEKAKLWSDLNGSADPRNIHKSTMDKYWIISETCPHQYLKSLRDLNNKGCPCPSCGNQELCHDLSCQLCLNSSFASHDKSKYWSSEKLDGVNLNGDWTPRHVFKSGAFRAWFQCNKCNHLHEACINDVVKTKYNNAITCPYCSTNTKILCEETDCQLCYP